MLPPNSANKQHPGQGHLRLVRKLAQNGTSGHKSSCLVHSRNICLSVCLSAMPPADSRSTPPALPLTEQSDGSFEGVRECVCVAMCVCVWCSCSQMAASRAAMRAGMLVCGEGCMPRREGQRSAEQRSAGPQRADFRTHVLEAFHIRQGAMHPLSFNVCNSTQ
jgi:hypothetical protein